MTKWNNPETGERMVVYRPLYKLPDMWEDAITALTRTEKNFNEPVTRDGVSHAHRFSLIEDQQTINACIEAAGKLYH